MKKTLRLKILAIVIAVLVVVPCFLFAGQPVTSNAATEATFKVTVSASEVRVGDTVTVTVTCDSTATFMLYKFDMSYPENLIQMESFNQDADADDGSLFVQAGKISYKYDSAPTCKKSVVSIKFKAVAVGAVTFSLNESTFELYRWDPVGDPAISCDKSLASFSIVEKGKSNDANLSMLEVSAGQLTPSFSKNVLDYTVKVSHDVETGLMYFGTSDPDAKQEIEGADEFLEYGENKRIIVITAPDGTVKKYTVTFIRENLPKETEKPVDATETPDTSSEPTEEPTDGPTDETTATPAPAEDTPIGEINTKSEKFVIYNIENYYAQFNREDELNIETFIVGGVQYKGVPERNVIGNTVYIVYAQPEGGLKELYTIDTYDGSMQRYYELLSSDEETASPTNGAEETQAPAGDKQSSPYSTKQIMLMVGLCTAVLILAIVAIAVMAKSNKRREELYEEDFD